MIRKNKEAIIPTNDLNNKLFDKQENSNKNENITNETALFVKK